MTNEKRKVFSVGKIAFYGTVAIALIIIGYYFFNSKQDTDKGSTEAINAPTIENSKPDSSVQSEQNTTAQEPTPTADATADTNKEPQSEKSTDIQDDTLKAPAPTNKPDNKTVQSSQAISSNSQQEAGEVKQADTNSKQPVTPTPQPETTPAPSPKPTEKPIEAAIKILKSDVTSQAKFYPYKLDDINMEVIAVKASDDSIRTALNTCQVCFDSGRGYYIQKGEYLVCQNCGNRFHVDQVEKVRGGCNPVPILEENRTELEDAITISKEFLAEQKDFFSNWKK